MTGAERGWGRQLDLWKCFLASGRILQAHPEVFFGKEIIAKALSFPYLMWVIGEVGGSEFCLVGERCCV
jgi:hypothetical protein